ncbi:MAG: hypothetical protein EOP84_23065, partial [Verrucomicrobiaceae bacterium]
MAKPVEEEIKRVPLDVAGWDYAKDRLKPETKVFIFGNDAGGVGKSLAAQFATIVLEEGENDFRLIECETQPRLTRLFPDRALYHEYDPDGQEQDPDAAGVYWDAFARQVTRTPMSVVDLSANAVKNLTRWADSGSGEACGSPPKRRREPPNSATLSAATRRGIACPTRMPATTAG